jgi:hypothetical protein
MAYLSLRIRSGKYRANGSIRPPGKIFWEFPKNPPLSANAFMDEQVFADARPAFWE